MSLVQMKEIPVRTRHNVHAKIQILVSRHLAQDVVGAVLIQSMHTIATTSLTQMIDFRLHGPGERLITLLIVQVNMIFAMLIVMNMESPGRTMWVLRLPI